ncbi:hypothetical protein MPL1032_180080 [Mesorhizobium plurifarium]|uniref:Uncharacterized protein n=1 Tax=Mesorhizobium plurifarium TaxID=69974 RepID=A0A0K2VU75_MESPL|nr:hypothetical protein MPL1032_180080 [Mesorhizobium plurifarium]
MEGNCEAAFAKGPTTCECAGYDALMRVARLAPSNSKPPNRLRLSGTALRYPCNTCRSDRPTVATGS